VLFIFEYLMETVAVLGLGRMGQGIAGRLLDCGYRVIVWNRSADKAKGLLEKGAYWADSPAAASQQARIIFSMVSDDAASLNVWLGNAGALENMSSGSYLIECSTLSADHVTMLSKAAKEKGVTYIDCPVTGLPEAAATGKLTLLVGAEKDDLEDIKPVLLCISKKISHFGPVGTGTAYKLIINLMGAVQIAALAEGIALAKKLGIDQEVMIDAIENSAAASPQVVRHTRKMAELDFPEDPLFTTSLRYKDAAYGVALATKAESPSPLGQAATNWFRMASLAEPDADEAAVINSVYKEEQREF
jgi:3-hydroxyisobutyrate dehydrogenase